MIDNCIHEIKNMEKGNSERMGRKTKVLMKGNFNYSNTRYKKKSVTILLCFAMVWEFMFVIEFISNRALKGDVEMMKFIIGIVYLLTTMFLTDKIYKKIFMKEVIITKYTGGLKIKISKNEFILRMADVRRAKAYISYGRYSRGKTSKLVIYTDTEVFHFTNSEVNEDVEKVASYINKGVEKIIDRNRSK